MEELLQRTGFQTQLTKILSEKCISHFKPYTYTFAKKKQKFYQAILTLAMNNVL